MDNKTQPPESLELSPDVQFNMYVQYLRKDLNLKQISKQNEALIFSTLPLISGHKEYNFTFYLMVLMECISTRFKTNVLVVFKPDRIKVVGTIKEDKLRQCISCLGTYERKSEKLLKEMNEKDKLKYGTKLFGIIIYFNFWFDNKRVMSGIFKDKNNEIKNYIYQALLDFNIIYKGKIKLDKTELEPLINKSKNFEEINISLSYSKDVQTFL